MSHADEGTLHAYLDGELAAEERAGLEAHLAGCAGCRTRLAEERDLVERAQGLLGRVAPPEAAVPPMRRTGGGGRGARPLPRWVPLAWAASVLLALGGGWMARGGRLPERPDTPGALALDRAEPPSLVDSAARADGPTTGAARERDTASPARGTTTDVTRGGRAAPAKATAEEERAVDRLAASPPAPVAQAAAPRAEAAGIVTSAVANADESGALTPLSIDSARAILGAEPVMIPGVPVRRIALGGAGVVVVEQALDATTVVRLYERRAEAAQDDGLRAVARQRSEVAGARAVAPSERLARYVGTLRVEIAGLVGSDSLSVLLGKVR